MAAGIPARHISLSAQELPADLSRLLDAGIQLNACSLAQLERFGQIKPGGQVGIRINPGAGSGGNNRTNVGGPSSSFGIWHHWIPQIKAILKKYDLTAVRIHTHIGSGSDPAVWMKVSGMSLDLCREFPTVTTLNLGGGYKVGRMGYEKSTDLNVVGTPVKSAFEDFAEETGRKLKLEIEPGTFLLANSCAIVCSVQDMVETGTDEGHTFIKLDAGMTEVLRPSLYAAQHPLVTVSSAGETPAATKKYVVVGHCCESGRGLLSPSHPTHPPFFIFFPQNMLLARLNS